MIAQAKLSNGVSIFQRWKIKCWIGFCFNTLRKKRQLLRRIRIAESGYRLCRRTSSQWVVYRQRRLHEDIFNSWQSAHNWKRGSNGSASVFLGESCQVQPRSQKERWANIALVASIRIGGHILIIQCMSSYIVLDSGLFSCHRRQIMLVLNSHFCWNGNVVSFVMTAPRLSMSQTLVHDLGNHKSVSWRSIRYHHVHKFGSTVRVTVYRARFSIGQTVVNIKIRLKETFALNVRPLGCSFDILRLFSPWTTCHPCPNVVQRQVQLVGGQQDSFQLLHLSFRNPEDIEVFSGILC